MLHGRDEMSDDFFAIDEAFQLMAGWIAAAASIAVREIVWIEVLNCRLIPIRRHER